jgi:hypothetical protein
MIMPISDEAGFRWRRAGNALAYARRTDGMFSDNQIRELLINKL